MSTAPTCEDRLRPAEIVSRGIIDVVTLDACIGKGDAEATTKCR
jgi:hypothetical protein